MMKEEVVERASNGIVIVDRSDNNEASSGNGGSRVKTGKTRRARWATRKMTIRSGGHKRLSIIDRLHKRTASCEKNRQSGTQTPGSTHAHSFTASVPEAPRGQQDANSTRSEAMEEEGDEGRTLFFNLPLPADMVDEEGHPRREYTRNKIRTAKYTPLSFIPKNLWNQFHNIANIFFLFLVILVIFPIFGGSNPGLNAVPLIVIIAATAVKDAVEDYRRTAMDIILNNAPVHRLVGWENVNVQVDNVSLWRRIKKATSRFFGALWYASRGLWKEEEEESKDKVEVTVSRLSGESETQHTSTMTSPRTDRTSFASAREEIQMTPVPSPLPRGPSMDRNIRISQVMEASDKQALARVKGNLINYKLAAGNARFHKETWKSLQVGDFVRLHNDDEIPADITVLSTSDPDGGCYVETKNLDGETNLKFRSALRCGRTLRHARDCERAQFRIESEAPQANLYKFNAAIHWQQTVDGSADSVPMQEAVSIDNLLLRGCNLRNTPWILGVVVFTGHDTKIMQNAGITPTKRARIARELNRNVIYNFGILAVMALISGIVNGIAWSKTDNSAALYDMGTIGGKASLTGFITFWSAVIVFQNLIPISLYISLEIVRSLQAIFIYSDVAMYYEPIDYPCTPKSWNISDDLGQIEYIFSDKTGTLTQNVMEFKKATVNGQSYGEAYTEAMAGMRKRLGIDVAKEAAEAKQQIAEYKIRALEALRTLHNNPYLHDDEVTFVAPDFVEDMTGAHGAEQKAANERFMLAMALCHSVIAEHQAGDVVRIVYKAQSPDEAALVATARDMGFTVLGGTSDGIDVNVMGEQRHYPILNTIEFNSTRKRMSAIVKMPDGKIMLFCKGADSIIYSRLKRGEQAELRKSTAQHLEQFAREGLRTLCIAERELSESEYLAWRNEHDMAAAALVDREEKLEEVADKIERDLRLLGGTAIEDRLQDGVPDAIALLAEGGIKLWVLTGDKVETAINIGFSCNLLNNDMDLIQIKITEDETGQTSNEMYLEQAELELDKHLATFGLTGSDEDLKAARKDHSAPAPTHALIIDGFALRWVHQDSLRQKFLLLCKNCKSVLCCRVSPAQKADVVGMVKDGLDVMTLSIGDGANDVAMIQTADIGVGIAGEEGRQAVMSADYAIGQFRFLERLVLVHGRWSYRRLAECISNFFYKNIVWTFCVFWYQCFCDFDITYVFDYTYILLFNLFFTSVPVILMGVLDQDVSHKVSLAVPQLYRRGIERLEWTQTKFWLYMADGFFQSLICFFIPYFAVTGPFMTNNGLDISDRLRLGAYIAHPAVLVINFYILLNTYRWDWLFVLVIVISDLLVFFWTGVYTSTTYSGVFINAASQVYGQPSFWVNFFITPVVCLGPRFLVKASQKLFLPYDVDIIREQVKDGKFDYLNQDQDEGVTSGSLRSSQSRSKRQQQAPIVEEDCQPIYPPSTATHNPRSQNGSDGTNFMCNDRQSLDTPIRTSLDAVPPMARASFDRVRPSYDRIRASMDMIRASYEQTNDLTTAAMLNRHESTHSGDILAEAQAPDGGNGIVDRIRNRTRGRSIRTTFASSRSNNDSNNHEHG